MYFVSKTLAEQEAWKFAKEHNLDLITIIPTLVVGPYLSSTMPPSLITALSLITGIYNILQFIYIYILHAPFMHLINTYVHSVRVHYIFIFLVVIN